jgi:hypothetical protein
MPHRSMLSATVYSLFATTALWLTGCSSAYTPSLHTIDTVGSRSGETVTKGYVFVTNDTQDRTGSPSEVLYWGASANGNVSPTGIIAGSRTKLVFSIQGIAVNGAGEIYVAEEYPREILGFAAGSHGNVKPNVVISGDKTALKGPIALALDKKGNIYVSDCAVAYSVPTFCGAPFSIKEYAASSNGNVAPIRTISGKKTGLGVSFGIAVSPSGDIYESNFSDNKVLEFGAHATGDTAPLRTIHGTKTQLNVPAGVAVDTRGAYTVNCPQQGDVDSLRFGVSAHGNVPPIAKVSGSKTRMQTCLEGLAVAGDSTVFVADRVSFVSGTPPCEILHFGADAKGDVAPLNAISGDKTHIFIPLFVAAATKI